MTVKSFLQSSLFAIAATTAVALPAQAQQCGEVPDVQKVLPDGATLDSNEMRILRNRVLDLSKQVDTYIACMEQRGSKLFAYMNEEQRDRYDEDLNKLHNDRRDMQIALNTTIRAYRQAADRRAAAGSSEGSN